MTGPYSIILDAPPSTNNLYLSAGRKRVKTVEYRRWIKASEEEFWVQGCYNHMPEKTPLWVQILACVGYKRDLDNLLKPLMDILQRSNAIADDRYVDRLSIERTRDGMEKGKVVVRWGQISSG